MNRMRFDLERVRRCLYEKGVVFTVRSYYAKACCDVWVEEVGMCRREYVSRVSCGKDIVSYVEHSGFGSWVEWREAILGFIEKGGEKHLYKVSVLHNGGNHKSNSEVPASLLDS